MSEGFVDVYDVNTGIKQRIPAHFLADPILGRHFKKAPSQRALDGELGQAPTADSTVLEIRKFAEDAEIDVTGLSRKDDLLDAIRSVVGAAPLPKPTPAGDVDVMPEGDVEVVAGTPTSTDATAAPDNSAAAAGQE